MSKIEFQLREAGRDYHLNCTEKQKWNDIFKTQHNSIMCMFQVHSVIPHFPPGHEKHGCGADNGFVPLFCIFTVMNFQPRAMLLSEAWLMFAKNSGIPLTDFLLDM